MNDPKPAEIISQFNSFCERWMSKAHPPQSPKEGYLIKLNDAAKRYKDAYRTWEQEGIDSPSAGGLDHMLACGEDLKRVKYQKEAVDQQEIEYQQKCKDVEKFIVQDLMNTLGRLIPRHLIAEWLAEQPALPTPAHEPMDTDPPPANIESDIQSLVLSGEDQQQPLSDTSTTPPPPNYANEVNHSIEVVPFRGADDKQDLKPQKRAMSPNPEQPTANKRRRPESSVSLTDRTIEFDEVYQHGRATKKFVIEFYKGVYYVVECEQHNKVFATKSPLNGARSHLKGSSHPDSSPTTETAIRLFGRVVLGCDEGLMELNNSLTLRPSYDEQGHPDSEFYPPEDVTDDPFNSPQTRYSQSVLAPQVDPQPGEVYTAFWPKDKRYYAILILPWDNFRSLGIPGWEGSSLEDTPHLKFPDEIPASCEYDPCTGAVGFADAYKPGGTQAAQREYPIMYFDAVEYPWKCNYGWVPVTEMCRYDPSDSSIPHKRQVDEFLLNYKNYQAGLTRTTDSNDETLPDESDDTNHSSPEVEQSGLFVDDNSLATKHDSVSGSEGEIAEHLDQESVKPDIAALAKVPSSELSSRPAKQQPTSTDQERPRKVDEKSHAKRRVHRRSNDHYSPEPRNPREEIDNRPYESWREPKRRDSGLGLEREWNHHDSAVPPTPRAQYAPMGPTPNGLQQSPKGTSSNATPSTGTRDVRPPTGPKADLNRDRSRLAKRGGLSHFMPRRR
ncbi:hypothetical protein NW752_001605 [Fusarium irregulare]|uniref:Uncharacterized protein n=1 Tax=Fusarium irregulare TaxID=2494466 RepID=A0A9W8PTX6_9HYPO|nr:hypothetical protein NW766_003765 [Fusarium irregulare]KAJ4026651.1 hypothetical protein NW752_001605 [Fusarium irregulare]